MIQDNLPIFIGTPGSGHAASVLCSRDWSPRSSDSVTRGPWPVAHTSPGEGHKGACLSTRSLTRSLTSHQGFFLRLWRGLGKGEQEEGT